MHALSAYAVAFRVAVPYCLGCVPVAVEAIADVVLRAMPTHKTDSVEVATEPEHYNHMDLFPSICAPIFIACSWQKSLDADFTGAKASHWENFSSRM